MRFMVGVAMAASLLAVPAEAEDENEINLPRSVVHDEVDTSFEATRARLSAEGFREVRMIDADPYRLGAFDTEGSEVQLVMSPQTGELEETVYEHPMDQ